MKNGTPSPGQTCTLAARILSALPAMMQAKGFDISQVLRHTEGEGEKLSRTLAFAFKSLCDGHASCVAYMQGGAEAPAPQESDELSKILVVDEARLVDLVAFLGKGWSYAEARDPRSAQLGLLADYSKVKLTTDWLQGKSSIDGETRRTRIIADVDHISLNADHCLDLWNNPKKIPDDWKKVKGVITFDGDVPLSPGGSRCVRCLYWGEGRWDRSRAWLEGGWYAIHPSAVLAS